MGCFRKFSPHAILFMILSLLLIPTSAHVQANEEGYISAVISKKGLDFVKDFLINKATSSIIPLKLPDIEKSKKIPLIGTVEMAISNIIIYSAEIDASYVETGDTGLLLAVTGATANSSMNWEYSYGSWLLPTISDNGVASVQVEGLEVGLTVALKEQGGAIKVLLVDCGTHAKDISIEVDGGASWLYEALFEAFEGKIRSAVESAVTKKIRELIAKLDFVFQSLPKRIPVSHIASMNISFVTSPVLRDSSVEVEINGLFTETSGTSILNYYQKGLQSSDSCSSPTKMVGIQLHENVFSSGALVYFNENRLHWIIDEVPDQSLLNTSGWKYILPNLYMQYPDDEMNLNISVTSPPIIQVSEHDIDATIDLDMTINVLDSSEVISVACISLVINASCSPEIKGGNLASFIRLNDFTTSLKWSNIGSLDMELFQSMISTILETGFLPYINLYLRRGFPLPLPHGFTLETAEIFCTSSWVVMEESKNFATQPTTYASHPLQTSFGAAAENRGTSHTVRMFPSDKISSSPTPSSGGFPASSPPVHVHAATSTSLPYQLRNNDVRAPTASIGLPSSHIGRDSSLIALPRVERPQSKLDGGSNGSSHVSQVQANASANHPLVNAPTWSVQPQIASSAKPGLENKVPNHNPVKVEGHADVSRPAPQIARDHSFRPFVSQTAPGNMPTMHQPSQGTNLVQAPQFGNNHNEIAKFVQKVLHPKVPEHPTWTPPSREYMNKALTCQICKLTANEVETVVLCDGCEKGFHLKCLQLNNQKGIPRGGEWHCMSCLKLSNGKPLPPKYGRVMRSMNQPKMPSNTSVIQSPSDKKVVPVYPKANNQQHITVNGSSSGSGALGSNSVELMSDSKIQNIRATQGGGLVSCTKTMDQETSSGSTKHLGAVSNPPPVVSSKGLTQPAQVCESSTHTEKLASELKSQHPAISSETVCNNSTPSQPSHNSQVVRTDLSNSAEVSLKNSHDNNSTVKQDEQVVAQPNPVGNSVISSDSLHSVEWIGEVLKIVDGKIFYQSCCIGGVTYKVQDHVILHSSGDKLMPSKLQTMWEDTGTGSKWVMVNRCFFPGDLPEAVGCPCAPERNELYESNNESSVMAGLIRGPCEVLPPGKFKEENERLNHLGNEANRGRRPLFLCQWFYDELKGVFRPVSG